MEEDCSEYESFCWIEEVEGQISKRKNRIVRADKQPNRLCKGELYQSIYLSGPDLVEYFKACKGPDNPSGVKGFRGACTIPNIPFDIDRELKVNGQKVPSYRRAVRDARWFLEALRTNHNVDLSIVQCSLTGGRGIHMRLPAELFGGFEPSINLPAVVKAIAKELATEAEIEIDLNIYDRNRILRVTNSRHRSGKYCIPVRAHELFNKNHKALVTMMKRPRWGVTWNGRANPVDSLVGLKVKCQERIGSGMSEQTRHDDPPTGRAEEIVAFLDKYGISYEPHSGDYMIKCPTCDHDDDHWSLGIDKSSGIYNCFGCDAGGDWEDFTRLIGRTLAIEKIPKDYRGIAEKVYRIRQRQKGDRRKEFEINAEVVREIHSHASKKGCFYQDGSKAYYFADAEKRLIGINPDDDSFRLLLHLYGINPADAIYRWVLEGLKNEALVHGQRTDVHRLSYYDPQKFTVYLSDHGNGIYRISPRAIKHVDNGTDGVLFLADKRASQFSVLEAPEDDSLFYKVLTSKINFAADVLTVGEREEIFELWFCSMFFGTIMPTKPIMTFIGPKGSGKSSTFRKVGKLLFGEKFDVTPLSDDSKDFDAAVSNAAFVAFDNADHNCRWLNDRLATVATGGIIKKRELYTTNKEIEIPVKCFIGMTSHTPHFRRDDVADRLIIMRVDRFEKFKSEKRLLAEVLENRNAIMTEVVYWLQDIVRALKKYSKVDDSSSFRMADFADFAIKVARHEGWEEELKKIFNKLSHEQSEFTLEGDPIFETLLIWVRKNAGLEMIYKELWRELCDVARREKIDFGEYENNFRGFARRMPNIRSNLEKFFEITDTPRRGRTVYHTFRLKGGECGE